MIGKFGRRLDVRATSLTSRSGGRSRELNGTGGGICMRRTDRQGSWVRVPRETRRVGPGARRVRSTGMPGPSTAVRSRVMQHPGGDVRGS